VQQLILSDNTLHSGHPSDHFHPSIIRIIHDAHYKSIINPKPLTQHKKWTTLGSRARYQIIPTFDQIIADARLIPSLQTLPLLRSIHQAQSNAAAQVAQPNTQLNTQLTFDHNHIPLIVSLSTFLAWRSQWTSINPTHQRKTNSPLTLIKQEPGASLILKYVKNHLALRTLFRLRHGRAFTHDIRIRFPSSSINQSAPGGQSANTALCKYGSCSVASINDSVQHLLVECPRHHSLRLKLLNEWSNHQFGMGKLSQISDLSLALLLGEPPTRHIKPINRTMKANFTSWYDSLAQFIIAVYQNLPIHPNFPKPL
jgi:hypothetical protein